MKIFFSFICRIQQIGSVKLKKKWMIFWFSTKTIRKKKTPNCLTRRVRHDGATRGVRCFIAGLCSQQLVSGIIIQIILQLNISWTGRNKLLFRLECEAQCFTFFTSHFLNYQKNYKNFLHKFMPRLRNANKNVSLYSILKIFVDRCG